MSGLCTPGQSGGRAYTIRTCRCLHPRRVTQQLGLTAAGPDSVARRRPGHGALYRRIAWVGLSAAVVLVSLTVVLPRAAGTQWSSISAIALSLSWPDIALLFAIWLAGLATYGMVQAAALPGLGIQRALLLNFAGSCISNVVPFGGVAGTSVNFAMIRRWNHSTQSFVRFIAVTHTLNLVAKLALPAVAIAALLATGTLPTGPLVPAGAAALGALVMVIAATAFVLLSESGASFTATALQTLSRFAGRALPTLGAQDIRASLSDFRVGALVLLKCSWARFSAGMAAYSLLQFLLFALCLRMVGCSAAVAVLFAAFAVERVMTLVVVTPGGVGLAETATAIALVALHADPAAGAAGVVIYRMFTYFFEIPVGAVWLAVWSTMRLRNRRRHRAMPAR